MRPVVDKSVKKLVGVLIKIGQNWYTYHLPASEGEFYNTNQWLLNSLNNRLYLCWKEDWK